jgi:hypothetical protein
MLSGIAVNPAGAAGFFQVDAIAVAGAPVPTVLIAETR